jgi:uncharacterized protein YuzB (UPF0349 family)
MATLIVVSETHARPQIRFRPTTVDTGFRPTTVTPARAAVDRVCGEEREGGDVRRGADGTFTSVGAARRYMPVECCLRNVTPEGRDALAALPCEVSVRPCLQRCGTCDEEPFVVADGTLLAGRSHASLASRLEGLL